MSSVSSDTGTLYIFSGLPGSGKTTLSQMLARRFGCVHLRIDTLEQGLRDLCGIQVEGEGYRLAYRIAADNLKLGMSVMADCCNPVELSRTEWVAVAKDIHARYLNIEVICSDKEEHRQRVETRTPTVPGLKLPTWQDVLDREYDVWTNDRQLIDTAGKSVEESFTELMQVIINGEPVSNTLPELDCLCDDVMNNHASHDTTGR